VRYGGEVAEGDEGTEGGGKETYLPAGEGSEVGDTGVPAEGLRFFVVAGGYSGGGGWVYGGGGGGVGG